METINRTLSQAVKWKEAPKNPLSKEQRLSSAVQPLLAWYREHARVLPWRQVPSPYRVWVSEIMLQQTRVEAVKPYFARFMEAYPTIADLAAAEDDQLMKLWEGLGYYSRARNLKKAAKEAADQYGGSLPGDFEKLKKLPGIGPYTAGAIASIAFQLPVPAVDGNVLRVVTRLTADFSDITQPAVKKQMEETLKQVMPKDSPGDFNQALMELGAMVCVPNGAPKCADCPWKGLCLSHRQQLTEKIPVKSPKKARKIETKTIFVIQQAGKTAVRKRAEQGLLAGLYEFPWLDGAWEKEQVEALLQQVFPMGECWKAEPLPKSKHIFTHIEWQMSGWRLTAPKQVKGPVWTASPRFVEQFGALLLARAGELAETYAIPSAFRTYHKAALEEK